MEYKYIKAVHQLVQDHFRNKFCMNFSEILDSSVGIQSILCPKQVDIKRKGSKYIDVLEWKDNFYYPAPNKKFYTSKDFSIYDPEFQRQRFNETGIHSIYNYYEELKEIPEKVIIQEHWNNRFSLSENALEKIRKTLKYTKEQMFKKGWIRNPLRELEPEDFKPYVFNFCGKEITFTIPMLEKLLKIIPYNIVDTTKSFFNLLYKIKAFALIESKLDYIKNQPLEIVKDDHPLKNLIERMSAKENSFDINKDMYNRIYDIFDSFCSKAKNYDAENNKVLYEKQNKYNVDFIEIIKTAKRCSLGKTLKVFGISYYDYCIYKSKKIKIPNINCNEYNDKLTKPFSDELGLEIIQANMGMGKTQRCMEFLEKNKDKSVLIISCKRTLANNFIQRFPEFIDYRDITNDIIFEEKVICQLESIHRIKRNFDIVIMDECHELINQIISPHHTDIMSLRERLKKLMASPVVKFMDANISNLVISFIQTYRDDFFWNRNTYKLREDFTYNFHSLTGFHDLF